MSVAERKDTDQQEMKFVNDMLEQETPDPSLARTLSLALEKKGKTPRRDAAAS